MKKIMIVLSLAATISPVSTMAQMRGELKAGMTRDMALAAAAKTFKRFDQNGDGTIDVAEVTAVLQARAAKSGKPFKARRASRIISRSDGNGDGKVTLAEFQAAAGAAFDRADTNKNGLIDPNEAKGGAGRGATPGNDEG